MSRPFSDGFLWMTGAIVAVTFWILMFNLANKLWG